jgi:putative ABC transport system substrate-binding protein
MPVVDQRIAGKPVPRISQDAMERECVARVKPVKALGIAFLDQRIARYERDIINMVGMGVTENAALQPSVKKGAVGFSVTYVRAKSGKGAALHRHATEEVFIPVKGRWQVFWLEGEERFGLGRDGALLLWRAITLTGRNGKFYLTALRRILAGFRPALVLSVALVATPYGAGAQTPQKVYRVAHLSTAGRTVDGAPPRPLRDGLRQLGYIEGQTVVYEARFAEGKVDRLPELAAQLVSLGVDIIVAQGRPAVVAAKQATSAIPIIIAPASSDAVTTGLIASLSRPGGNVTGLSDELEKLSAKRMELLKETLPNAARIAVLWNMNDPGMNLRYHAIEQAAQILSVMVESHALRSPDDFDAAFNAMRARRPDGLFLVTDALTNMNQKRVVEFSATYRIPAMYESSAVVRLGGLMSYGPSPQEMFRRAVSFIDRIFKGAKPSELPAEQPTKYEFTMNLTTAKSLGLEIQPMLLVRADEVIE